MPLTKPPCSDTTTDTSATTISPVLVLEGMPGAGKTTVAAQLHGERRVVIGEYTTQTGEVIPAAEHPAVDDDTGHQRNWLRKHQLVEAARARGPVFVDRDWLSALAYAYSVSEHDHGALLARRTAWALGCLDRGDLSVASTYVLFQLDPRVSLRRRTRRLTPNHPWSSLPGLIRLAAFYADPATALAPVHPELAALLRTTIWHPLRGCSIDRAARFIRDLADQP